MKKTIQSRTLRREVSNQPLSAGLGDTGLDHDGSRQVVFNLDSANGHTNIAQALDLYSDTCSSDNQDKDSILRRVSSAPAPIYIFYI